jgi:hypothetical protein
VGIVGAALVVVVIRLGGGPSSKSGMSKSGRGRSY